MYSLLSTPNQTTGRISQGHSLYHVWTLLNHSFFNYAADNSVKNALSDPVTLTFDLSIPKSMSLLEYLKNIPYTKFEHFRIILFWVIMRQTIRQTIQTYIQTDSNVLPTPTDTVSVGVISSFTVGCMHDGNSPFSDALWRVNVTL